MATICIFIGAMKIILVNWFLNLLLVHLLFTGPAVCCVVVGNRVCTTLDTANQNCAEADSLHRLQVDSWVVSKVNHPPY